MARPVNYLGFYRSRADLTHSGTGEVATILIPGVGTGTHARQLHIAQAGDGEVDFNLAAQSNPVVLIHSVTTPATDFLSIGGHDGVTATINVAGGTALALQTSGTTRLTMNAIGLSIGNNLGLVIGGTTQVTGAAVAELQVLGTAVADSSIQLGAWSADAVGAEITFIKSQNTTINSNSIVTDNDVVGRLVWLPDDGTDFATIAATFRAEVDDASPAGGGDVGMAFVWDSMPGAAGAIEEHMRMAATGSLFLNQQAQDVAHFSLRSSDVATGMTTINLGPAVTTNDYFSIGKIAGAIEEHMRMAATGSLFLNQQAQDVAHFSLRSSDVATGMTTINLGPAVTTNDYFSIGKIAGATGGAYLTSIAETAVAVGMHVEAWSGQPALTDTDTSLGVMNFFAGVHDDANGDTDMTDDGNAFVWGEIDSGGTRRGRMLLKGNDGELSLGNTTINATPLDNEDDILMIRQLQKGSGLMDGIVHSIYDDDLDNPFYDHAKLTELGVVSPKSEDGFYYSKLQPTLHLHEGAMWQMHNDMMGIASVLSPAQRRKLPDRVKNKLALAGV